NITHDECVTFNEIVNTFERVMGKKADTQVIKNMDINSLSYFPYYDMPYMLSIEKLKSHGLHVPEYNLEDGLRKAYEWYKKERPTGLLHRMDKLEGVRMHVKSER
ncbi:MAG: hypothetical protein MI799_13340, partial [Desulfobacterales bacterium]|nr:hypothetical protein [Desulfobacterales bacterium]